MQRATLDALRSAHRDGRLLVRAVALDSGEEKLIDPATDCSEWGIAAAKMARARASGVVTIDNRAWLFSVYDPAWELVIVGAVHIAQALAGLAGAAGYRVRIIDPRPAFASEGRFPGTELTHAFPDEALAEKPLGPRSALVVLAHDPKIDDPGLIAALRSPAFYVGALGSKRTHATRLERLTASGFDADALARIKGPVGLSIGARSPAEIAISILAQMTETLRT